MVKRFQRWWYLWFCLCSFIQTDYKYTWVWPCSSQPGQNYEHITAKAGNIMIVCLCDVLISLHLSDSVGLTHTHTRARARTHTRTHERPRALTHTQLSLLHTYTHTHTHARTHTCPQTHRLERHNNRTKTAKFTFIHHVKFTRGENTMQIPTKTKRAFKTVTHFFHTNKT